MPNNTLNEMANVTYLGDGVFIGINRRTQIVLYTSNGIEITNEIVLDDVDIKALVATLNNWFL